MVVGSSMCWIGVTSPHGQNHHQNYDRAQSFVLSRQGARFFHLCFARQVVSSLNSLCHGTQLSTPFTISRCLAHGLFTPSPHYHDDHLSFTFQCTQKHRTRPNPFFFVFVHLLPPLLSLIEVFISTPFPHPPLPFHICCSPSCSSSVDPHCT